MKAQSQPPAPLYVGKAKGRADFAEIVSLVENQKTPYAVVTDRRLPVVAIVRVTPSGHPYLAPIRADQATPGLYVGRRPSDGEYVTLRYGSWRWFELADGAAVDWVSDDDEVLGPLLPFRGAAP